MTQGMLGVFLREPLLDWIKEARNLKRSSSRKMAGADELAQSHVNMKVHGQKVHSAASTISGTQSRIYHHCLSLSCKQ